MTVISRMYCSIKSSSSFVKLMKSFATLEAKVFSQDLRAKIAAFLEHSNSFWRISIKSDLRPYSGRLPSCSGAPLSNSALTNILALSNLS